MSGLKRGVRVRTTSHKIACFWPTAGKHTDTKNYNDISMWIVKCGRAIDKKEKQIVLKELVEQFPMLDEVEVSDYADLVVKWSKP